MTRVRFAQPGFPAIVERFFNDERFQPHTDHLAPRGDRHIPAVNVKETDAAFVIEVAAPGMKKEDFSINLQEDRLIISGNHEAIAEESNEKYTRREFGVYSFQRSFVLPKNVQYDDIAAAYTDGILQLTLPKKGEEKPLQRQINVG